MYSSPVLPASHGTSSWCLNSVAYMACTAVLTSVIRAMDTTSSVSFTWTGTVWFVALNTLEGPYFMGTYFSDSSCVTALAFPFDKFEALWILTESWALKPGRYLTLLLKYRSYKSLAGSEAWSAFFLSSMRCSKAINFYCNGNKAYTSLKF